MAEGIEQRLLRDRIIILGTPIDDEIAEQVIAKLLFLDQQDPARDINLYLNSPGGAVTAGLAIHDTMGAVSADVCTLCVGQAAGVATLLVAAGARDKRFAVPNARLQLLPLSGGSTLVAARALARTEQTFVQLLAAATGASEEVVRADLQRSRSFSADEARAHGLIDGVIPLHV